MFSRRVFGSGAIPRTMYTRLHISSNVQAQRLVPSLIPLSVSIQRSVPLQRLLEISGQECPTPLKELSGADPIILRAFLDSVASMQLNFLKLLELWGIGRPLRVVAGA